MPQHHQQGGAWNRERTIKNKQQQSLTETLCLIRPPAGSAQAPISPRFSSESVGGFVFSLGNSSVNWQKEEGFVLPSLLFLPCLAPDQCWAISLSLYGTVKEGRECPPPQKNDMWLRPRLGMENSKQAVRCEWGWGWPESCVQSEVMPNASPSPRSWNWSGSDVYPPFKWQSKVE